MSSRLLAFGSLAQIPFMHNYAIDAAKVLELSGATRLGDLNDRNFIVKNSLRTLKFSTPESFCAIDDHARSFGDALNIAMTASQVLWVCEMTLTELAHIRNILGQELVHDISLPGTHPSPDDPAAMVPVAISPNEFIQHWGNGSPKQQRVIAQLLDETDTLRMSNSTLAALHNAGTSLIERNGLLRFMANPKVIAYFVVLVYSSLRALPVMFVPGFHGKVWVLWMIDLITAIPYTWGIIEMFAGRTLLRRFFGLIVTVVTFISPYIYFWVHGRNYPLWVTILVIVMIIGAIAIEYLRWLRDRIVTRVLAENNSAATE